MLSKPIITKDNKITSSPYISVHSGLALAISLTKDANLQRAFSIWAVLRSSKQCGYTQQELLVITQKTAKCKRTIKRWLASGEGIFWNSGFNSCGQKVYYKIGKDLVFKYFKLINPGVTLGIHIKYLLTKKLHNLKATLKDCFFNKEIKWASRNTIEKVTGVLPRTQQNYDAETGIARQYICEYKRWKALNGKEYEVRQLPNRYFKRFERYRQTETIKNKKYGLYVIDSNAQERLDENQGITKLAPTNKKDRILFDDKEGAFNKAERMSKKGVDGFLLYKDTLTDKKNMVVKAIYSDNVYKERIAEYRLSVGGSRLIS